MGAWGESAYDNDNAADWFATLHGLATLADEVLTTLRTTDDPNIGYDEWRAAAFLLARIGTVYVWPIEQLAESTRLAIERLETILADTTYLADWTDPAAFRTAVQADLDALTDLRHTEPTG